MIAFLLNGTRIVKYLTIYAANAQTGGDLEMQVEPTSGGSKMSKCALADNYTAQSIECLSS